MNKRPLVIEFTGLPNSGKTTLIHNLSKKLEANGFKVQIMQEDAELVPKEIPKKTWIRNVWITFGQLQSLLEIPYSTKQIILLDRGYCDALFWVNFLYKRDVCSKEQSESLKKILYEMNEQFDVFPDYLFVIDVSIEESIKRRAALGGKTTQTNKDFLSFYKNELKNFYKNVNCPIWYLDTTILSIQETLEETFDELMKHLS